jgi:hypothetical protein
VINGLIKKDSALAAQILPSYLFVVYLTMLSVTEYEAASDLIVTNNEL